MNKPKPSKVVICIYAESPFRIKSVKRLLDEIFVEETVYHRKKVIEGLKNRQVIVITFLETVREKHKRTSGFGHLLGISASLDLRYVLFV